MLEYPFIRTAAARNVSIPLADEILSEPLAIENGDLFVPNARPWNEIDESVIQNARSFRSWSFFKITSRPKRRRHRRSQREMDYGPVARSF